jgi:hypothetical protein
MPFAVAPEWLLELIRRASAEDERAADSEHSSGMPSASTVDHTPLIPEGRRHQTLLKEAGRLRWLGYGELVIHAVLRAMNAACCRPPLDEEEVDRLAADVVRRYRPGARTTPLPRDAEPAEDRTEGDAGSTTDATWPDVLPLEAALVPPFPVHVLPPVLADVITDIARVTHTPLDFAGLGTLLVVSTLASRRVDVAIGPTLPRITHIEPLNLYGMLIANSGERKGPVHRAVLAPLFALERRLQDKAAPELKTKRERRKLAERRLERLREQAAREDDDTARSRLNDAAIRLALTLPAVPSLPVLVVSDRTVEMLEVELMQQDGALLLASEEAGSLLAIMGGRFTKDGSMQIDVYLKGYDRGEINVARISRDPVQCATPELSIFMTPQRSLLRELRARPEFHDRGVLPRFLFCLPVSPVGQRSVSTTAPRQTVRVAYAMLLDQLVETWSRVPAGEQLPHLFLTGASWERWAAYAMEIEVELQDLGKFGSIQEWANKHPGRVARLAGLLHLATFPTRTTHREISPETIEAACVLGEYGEAHALAVYDLMGALPHIEGARRILRWLRYAKKALFSERDVSQAFRIGRDGRFFASMDDLRPCLRLLVEHGYLRPEGAAARRGPGRRPSPSYVVHPGWLTTQDHHYHHYDPANFEDSEDKNPTSAPGDSTHGDTENTSSQSSESPPRGNGDVESSSSESSKFAPGNGGDDPEASRS